MRNPYWKPQHEVFIRCMLRHGDATKAYRSAYPKANKASARVGGIRLNSYLHIRQRIQPILAQRRKEADLLTTKLALARKKAEVLRRDHIRGVLYAMAKGEIKKDRRFIVNGQTITLQEDLSHRTLLNLISLDLKLADGYNNWNSIERQFTELTHNTSTKIKNVDKGRGCAVIEIRQQTVINSPENPIPASLPANAATPENHQKTDNKTIIDNNFPHRDST